MYLSAYHRESGCLVQVLLGKHSSDAEYERMLEDGLLLDRDHTQNPEGTVHLLVTNKEHERPNANWRKRFSDMTKDIQSKRYIFALVAPSVLIRGVMTAINWLTPPPPTFRLSSHQTIEAAISWIEEQRGEALPILRQLYNEALAKQPAVGHG